MKTIGELLKEKRVKKRHSQARLEKITKIRKSYIDAIEKENWNRLPERPVVAGFVKNIAQALNVDQRQTSALFRRDYPPRSLRVNPKPDVLTKFVWSPRLTFLVGVLLVVFGIFAYLIAQYISFIRPPSLEVITPTENEIVNMRVIEVAGFTDADASVVINNQPVIVKEDGKFVAEIEIFEGTEVVVIKAKSRSGKETLVRRKIIPDLR